MKEKNSNVSKKYPYLCDKAGKNCKNEDVTKSMDSTGEEQEIKEKPQNYLWLN